MKKPYKLKKAVQSGSYLVGKENIKPAHYQQRPKQD